MIEEKRGGGREDSKIQEVFVAKGGGGGGKKSNWSRRSAGKLETTSEHLDEVFIEKREGEKIRT